MRSALLIGLASAALVVGVTEAGAVPPPNNDFGNATVVTTLPFSVSVNLGTATGAADDPTDCWDITQGRTVWYAYTPAEATRIRATHTSADTAALSVSLYTGTRGALQMVACESGNRFASFKVDLLAGTTYYVMLESQVEPAVPLRSLLLERIAPATNDEVASATTVDPLPFDQIVDGRLLTRAPSDPSCGAGWTAWYVFTAPSPMRVEVETLTPSEARIGVYAGAPSDGSQVLCSFPNFQSTRRFEVSAGTYYVLVAGADASANKGDLAFRLREVPPLATNDDFDQAKVVGALPLRDWVDTRQATVAPDDPLPCPYSSYGSVWYAFTAPRDMRIVADASGTTEYNSISVYTGPRGGLTRVACGSSTDAEPTGSTGSVGARVSFMGAAGTTYYFMVTLQDSEGGDVVFSMPLANSLTLAPSKSPIRFGSSLRLTGHVEAFAETANDQVTIYATPYGQGKRAIATVLLDAAGNFALTVRPRARTTYVAEWTGDGPYPAVLSPQRTVGVRAVANLRLLGWFGRSGATKLYRRGTNPSLVAWVNPAHVGRRIVLQLQARRPGGPWSSPATASFRIGATGRVRVVITGLPSNLTYRVRSQFRADADHLGSFSPWNVFRFA